MRELAFLKLNLFSGLDNGVHRTMGTIVTLIILGLILNVSEMVPLIASTLQRPVESSLVISLLAAVSYWCICCDSR